MMFRELALQVLEQRDNDGVRGLDRELSRWRRHLSTASFAEKDIADVTSPDIREWLRTMAQKQALGPGEKRTLSRQTISRCQSLVSAVFVEAVERELIGTNPCLGVKLKRRVDERDTRTKWAYLLPEEQRAFVSCPAIPLEHKLCVRFAIGTGLRQAEQRFLGLDDLVTDGDDPHVLVRVAGRKNGKPLPPKSGKARKVQLFDDGLAAAREWLEFLPTFCPQNLESLAFPTATGGLRQQGKFLGRSDTLRKDYAAAGIKLRPHLHWHALRHSFASNLVAGVWRKPLRLEIVQILMGHSSLQVTQRYAHLSEDAVSKAVREAADMAISPVPPDTLRDLAALAGDEAAA